MGACVRACVRVGMLPKLDLNREGTVHVLHLLPMYDQIGLPTGTAFKIGLNVYMEQIKLPHHQVIRIRKYMHYSAKHDQTFSVHLLDQLSPEFFSPEIFGAKSRNADGASERHLALHLIKSSQMLSSDLVPDSREHHRACRHLSAAWV